MKKIVTLLVIASLVMSIGLFATGCIAVDTSTDEPTSEAAANETIAKPEESSNELGDYTVDIQSCRLAKDYEGKDVVIVKYLFTNVSNDTATSFTSAVNHEVFQGGVGLNQSLFLDDSANYNSDNSLKDIKKGASLEVEVAYELNDTTTDIEVEVSEFFSFDDAVVTKTFSLK